jgi:hypothetical protein
LAFAQETPISSQALADRGQRRDRSQKAERLGPVDRDNIEGGYRFISGGYQSFDGVLISHAAPIEALYSFLTSTGLFPIAFLNAREKADSDW